MTLFSHSANLETDLAESAFAWAAPKARVAVDETLDFTIDGIDFEVGATGFGAHRDELEGALVRVQLMLAVCTTEELQDPAVVEAVAATAVRRETKAWRCWSRGYRGKRPALAVRYV
jgi:hypothetical protein